jgi:hypothetical protein
MAPGGARLKRIHHALPGRTIAPVAWAAHSVPRPRNAPTRRCRIDGSGLAGGYHTRLLGPKFDIVTALRAQSPAQRLHIVGYERNDRQFDRLLSRQQAGLLQRHPGPQHQGGLMR